MRGARQAHSLTIGGWVRRTRSDMHLYLPSVILQVATVGDQVLIGSKRKWCKKLFRSRLVCIWLSPNKCSPSYCTAYIVNCLGQVTECSYCAAWPCTYSHSPATIYIICVPCLTVPHATVSLNEQLMKSLIIHWH